MSNLGTKIFPVEVNNTIYEILGHHGQLVQYTYIYVASNESVKHRHPIFFVKLTLQQFCIIHNDVFLYLPGPH